MKSTKLNKKIDEVLEELRIANETIPIIVEGKNDEVTLRKLGFKGQILRFNIGQSVLTFCEDIAKSYDEVILLLDWDDKGQQLLKKFKNYFEPTNVTIFENFWQDLKRFCSKDIHQVEYLHRYFNDNNSI